MAERTITTRLVAEGESQYRATIKGVNNTLRELDSELQMADAAFARNEGSMEALRGRYDALQNSIAALQTKQQVETEAAQRNAEVRQKAVQAMEQYKAAMERMQASATAEDKQTQAYQDTMAQLQAKYAAASNAADAAANAESRHSTAANKAAAQIDKLGAELDEVSAKLKENANAGAGFTEGLDALSSAIAGIDGAIGLEKIKETLMECITAASDFEFAMAGVQRTVGGDADYLNQLGDSFKNMSTQIPLNVQALAKIAETAGQLGVAQDQVESFTEVMARLATTTDLTADMAATKMAQFGNITGNTDWGHLGATIAALGDSTATTASKIVDMSQAIAATANLAGMSATDILGMSAALGSLGIEAASGGTSMSTLISTLQKAVETGNGLEDFANVANMTSEAFAQLWSTDAASAMTQFIEGLSDTERIGKSAMLVLSDIGINNARQQKAVLGLASANGLLSSSIAAAGAAWDENAALMEKSAVMYDTTAAKEQMFSNSLENVKAAVGNGLKPAFEQLLVTGTSISTWAAEFISQNEWIVSVIGALVTTITTFGATVGAVVVAVKAWTAAQTLLNAAMNANPILLAVSAVIALTAGIGTLIANMDHASEESQDFNTHMEKVKNSMSSADNTFAGSSREILTSARAVNDLCGELDKLAPGGQAAEENIDRVKVICNQLNGIMPGLGLSIDETTGKITAQTEAIRENAAAWLAQQVAQAASARTQEYVDAYTSAYYDQVEAQQAMIASSDAANEAYRRRAAALDDLKNHISSFRDTDLYPDDKAILKVTDDQLRDYVQMMEQFGDEDLNTEEIRDSVETFIEARNAFNEATAQNVGDTKAFYQARDAVNQANAAMENALKVEQEVVQSYAAQTDAILGTTAAVETLSGTVSTELPAAAEQEQRAVDSIAGAMAGQVKAAEEAADSAAELKGAWQEASEDIVQRSQDLRDGVLSSLGMVEGAFDKTKKISGNRGNVDRSKKNAKTNLQNMQNYEENLRFLQEMNEQGTISDELLASVADGSKEAMQNAADYAAAGKKSEKKLSELSETYTAVLEESRKVAELCGQILEGTDADMQAAIDKAATLSAAYESALTDAQTKTEQLQTNLDALAAASVSPTVECDTAAAQTAVDQLQEKLGLLGDRTIRINLVTSGGEDLPVDGSHAAGLDSVPYDNYIARLHEGEMVLTKLEARAYRAERMGSGFDYRKMAQAVKSAVQGMGSLVQTINFNQPVQSPDEYARQVWQMSTAGMQG